MGKYMNVSASVSDYPLMRSASAEELKRIEAKIVLDMKLTPRERTIWAHESAMGTLYGTTAKNGEKRK